MRHYCLLLLLCLAHASADTAGIQHFVLPGHGTLDLSVPSSWRAQVHQPANPLPPTVTLAPTAGEPFRVLITAVWPLPPNTQLANLAEIREQVAGAAHDASPQSVEKVLPLEELKGTENRGYFFRATDQAPKAGEFKYLTQGIIRVGGVNVAFTVLTNDGQESVVAAALDTLRTAGQHPED